MSASARLAAAAFRLNASPAEFRHFMDGQVHTFLACCQNTKDHCGLCGDFGDLPLELVEAQINQTPGVAGPTICLCTHSSRKRMVDVMSRSVMVISHPIQQQIKCQRRRGSWRHLCRGMWRTGVSFSAGDRRRRWLIQRRLECLQRRQ